MRAEDLSRTSWVIISLIIGVAMAFMRTVQGLPAPTQTDEQHTLETGLFRGAVKGSDGSEFPYIKGLTIYPSVERVMPGNKMGGVALVTFDVLTPSKDRNGWYYRPGATLVNEPVIVDRRFADRMQVPENTSAKDYFAMIGATVNRKVSTYAWWYEPKWIYILWVSGSLVVVGIAWPIALSKLVGAGLGKKSEDRRPSLWQQWKESRKSAKQARPSSHDPVSAKGSASSSSATLSPEDLARINQMEDGLKDFLTKTSAEAREEEDIKAEETKIRALNAGPMQSATVEEKTEQPKDYRGEFYPTIAHAPKKNEDSSKS